MQYDKSCSILLLGNSAVGKTSLISRYANGTFKEEYINTVGIDSISKTEIINNINILVKLWDTAGQERFRTIAKSYYRGAHGIILMYDVTNPKSFESMRKWLTQIKEEAPSKIRIILVANKIDSEERVVSKEDGDTLAKSYSLKIFESSAKENINVNEAFQDLIEDININYSHMVQSDGAQLNNSKSKKEKKGCC